MQPSAITRAEKSRAQSVVYAGSLLLWIPLALTATAARAGEKASRLELLDPAEFDRPAAAHLLSRAGFGGTPEEIDALVELGLEKAVDRLLTVTASGQEDDRESSQLKPVLAELRQQRRRLRTLPREEQRKIRQEFRRKDRRQFQRLRAWWFRRMVTSPDPLVEKMTLFWHGHFATSQQTVGNSYHMFLQNQTLRANALGNFKKLVHGIVRDPAMLRYLDNNRNNRRRPNENLARELMELFTLGPGNYTEKDIKEAARALTGWTFRGAEFSFNRRAHDPEEKTFMGKTGLFDADDIVDIIFEHPEASRFVTGKLFAFFVHDDPPKEIIDSLAATFRDNRFEIKPVLSQLFRSQKFYSEAARGSQIKSPVQLVAGTMRLLEIDPARSAVPAGIAGRMGQNLFLPRNVKGWEGGQKWVNTTTLFDRTQFSRVILNVEESPADRRRGRRRRRVTDDAMASMPSWTAANAEKLLGENFNERRAEDIVDELLQRFLVVSIPKEARQKLIDHYRRTEEAVRIQELIYLILSSPQYQLG